MLRQHLQISEHKYMQFFLNAQHIPQFVSCHTFPSYCIRFFFLIKSEFPKLLTLGQDSGAMETDYLGISFFYFSV